MDALKGYILRSGGNEEPCTRCVKDPTEEKKISHEGSIWEELRRYGIDNKELEEFTGGLRV